VVAERTALANEIRSLLLEHGILISQGVFKIIPYCNILLDPESEEIFCLLKRFLSELIEELKNKTLLIKRRDEQLREFSKISPQVQQLMTIPGIGIVGATALVGKVGDVNVFRNGRQFSAWLGLVPQQFSTGGKVQLERISKRGDRYLRSLLIRCSTIFPCGSFEKCKGIEIC